MAEVISDLAARRCIEQVGAQAARSAGRRPHRARRQAQRARAVPSGCRCRARRCARRSSCWRPKAWWRSAAQPRRGGRRARRKPTCCTAFEVMAGARGPCRASWRRSASATTSWPRSARCTTRCWPRFTRRDLSRATTASTRRSTAAINAARQNPVLTQHLAQRQRAPAGAALSHPTQDERKWKRAVKEHDRDDRRCWRRATPRDARSCWSRTCITSATSVLETDAQPAALTDARQSLSMKSTTPLACCPLQCHRCQRVALAAQLRSEHAGRSAVRRRARAAATPPTRRSTRSMPVGVFVPTDDADVRDRDRASRASSRCRCCRAAAAPASAARRRARRWSSTAASTCAACAGTRCAITHRARASPAWCSTT